MRAEVGQEAGVSPGHTPVMLREVLTALAPKDGGVYIDGTFGTGGYTRALLASADCTVYAIDRDPEAIAHAKKLAHEFPGRLIPLHGCFGDMETLLQTADAMHIDGIVLDIGVSSPQIDSAQRGFSFRHEGPLDMRMGGTGVSAADVVNTASEDDLADILFTFGEERAARRIARRIVTARAESPLRTTSDLARTVHDILPMHGGMKTDTATRTFQALRIYINDELGELTRALNAAERLLTPGGALVVVTFHSLEDRIVKHFFRERARQSAHPSRHRPLVTADAARPLSFRSGPHDGDTAGATETQNNPRARSARLRSGIRTNAPPFTPEAAHA